MRLHKWLLALLALSLIVAACGDDDGEVTELQTIKPGVLTVGSDIPWPPFEDYDAAGNVIGFDADVVNEMARRLALETEWIDTDFDTIFTQLASAQFDVVASGTTILPERLEMVNFTDGYFNSNQALTINTNETPDIKGTADLKSGDSIAVQTGTTGAIWANENLAGLGIVVREFPAAPDTYGALEGGQVTGVIFDVDSALEEAGNRPGLAVVEEILTGEIYGFGVNPENEALLNALNRVFREMVEDGFYQQTYDKWFDRPEGSILYEP